MIAALTLFTVIGSVSFDNIKNVYAAKDLNVKVSIDDDDIERGNTQKITVMVTEDGNAKDKISGADVKLTVHPQKLIRLPPKMRQMKMEKLIST